MTLARNGQRTKSNDFLLKDFKSLDSHAAFADLGEVNRFALYALAAGTSLMMACSSSQSNGPRSDASPPQPWTGTWVKLDGLAVPREKQMRLVQTCSGWGEYWRIEQKDNKVLLELHDATQSAGVNMAVERTRTEWAKGTRNKSFAKLDGEFATVEIVQGDSSNLTRRGPRFPVTYELEWDAKTEHLFGTRNGAPIRFIRVELQSIDASQCPPPK